LKEGGIVSIGAISSIFGPFAELDTYNSIKAGTAAGVSTTATQAPASGTQASGAKTPATSSGKAGDAPDDAPGTGISAIEAAVQTFMSDYQNVYGSGQPVEVPPESGAPGLDMAQLTSALRAMSRDFSQFFGRALGTDVQPFGLPLSSEPSLANEQAARTAIRSSGSAGQTAAPVVPPDNESGEAAMAATGIPHAGVSDNNVASAGGSYPGGPALPVAKGDGGT
jgi:hypothetical protein